MRTQILLPAGVAIALTLVAAFYFARNAEVAPAEIAVTKAWARATPPGASVGAVYLTIENKGGAADRWSRVDEPGRAIGHAASDDRGERRQHDARGRRKHRAGNDARHAAGRRRTSC